MNEREALDELSRRGEQPTLKPQTLSGQQMQTLAARYNTQLQEIYRDIKLRELALEQACRVTADINKAAFGMKGDAGALTIHDPVALAKEMHAFLVEGAQEEKQ
jgi:hypothetical protein